MENHNRLGTAIKFPPGGSILSFKGDPSDYFTASTPPPPRVINAYGQGALNFTLCERKSCSKSEIYLEQLGSFNASDISDVDTGRCVCVFVHACMTSYLTMALDFSCRYYYRVESGDSNQTEPQVKRTEGG